MSLTYSQMAYIEWYAHICKHVWIDQSKKEKI